MEKYNITLEDGNIIEVGKNTKFIDIINSHYSQIKDSVILCRLNYEYYELNSEIKESGNLTLVQLNSQEGMNVYKRTLQFIFVKAAFDLFPQSKITIEHSISKCIFGEIHKKTILNREEVEKIKERMIEIINSDLPIEKNSFTKKEAIELFDKEGMDDKVSLLKSMEVDSIDLYKIEDRYDYFYGLMAISTGIIKTFDLKYYEPGFILRYPERDDIYNLPEFKEQKKLFNIFYETEKWLEILEVGDVGSLNKKIEDGKIRELVMVSEALHEKKIAYIADNITNKHGIKMVLIAGPSSSGKTTFSKRLSIQLRVNGFVPVPISLDDYFVNREDNPKDENGEYDFESILSLDLKTLNEHFIKLLNGEEVEVPSYNFKTGKREWHGNKLRLPKNGILIVEGIHALNPKLTEKVKEENKYKVYISALTQLNLDNHNRIHTTDVRKIRRIVRDYLSRGYGGEDTLKMWPSIKRGEKKNIFVYQEDCEDMFNSTLVYELSVLKPFALKELNKIKKDSPVYAEAYRLKSFLSFFKEIPMEYVPENSIFREFIGGSCFYDY
ncbi:nucleoside kinase [Clostridium thermobutyricum]|uniref:Threonine--tRNA ligase 1 n=1 Tax=Clostridium thermobutyricum DSM 4928 TaxID=1121339 RepID=A0A1V4SWL0_9CLOT|nr:nucleoside kinase [Clostridium thermobutyricum]OPX48888.1 threonine--tRNA ligase 1 [Clostridium thermobutyricum DSM 4928]